MAYNPYDNKSPYGNSPYGQPTPPQQSQQGYGRPQQYAPPPGAPPQNQQNPYQNNQYQEMPQPNQYAAPQSNYNRPAPAQYPQQNVEMGRIGTPNKDYAAPPSKDYSAGPYGNAQLQNHQQPSATDTRPILEQCSAISSEIRKLQEPNGSIDRIKRAHKVYAARDDTNVLREIDEETDLVKRQLRGMTERIKEVETLPGSHSNPANHAQIESCKRSIGRALDTFLAEDRRFRDDVINAQARQFMLVKPGISMQEATRMAEDDNGQTQVFQQSIINSDRLGQVNTTRNAVQARSDAIQNIAQTVTEILQLQADLARTVEEQQPYIEKIENNTQEAHENVVVANTQIVGATEKARAARKKKWICLTIVVLLILIVVAIVLAYGATQGGWFKKNNNPAQ